MEKKVLSFIEENSVSELNIYDVYSSEVSHCSCLDSDKNLELMKETVQIIHQLENIFKQLGCDDNILSGKKVPWIADKYEYCVKHCKDIELLNELKTLYEKYRFASNKVIEGNLRLVIEKAGDYKTNQIISFEDIIQYGNMGLMRAVEKYNPECGISFSTYACYWIIQSINKNIRGVMSGYRVPSYLVYHKYGIMNSYNDLCVKLGRNATIEELSQYIGKPVSDIEEMRMIFTDSLSLDEVLDVRYGNIEITRGDMIEDTTIDVLKEIINAEILENLTLFLREHLTAKQFDVMNKYLGLDGIGYNQEEIAVLLNLSPQRISQLKKDSVKRLKKIPSFIDSLLD